jgi:hypothetical protein
MNPHRWSERDPGSSPHPRAPFEEAATINAARAWVQQVARTKEGGVCPCCDQMVKVYKRTITSSMAYALILIERYYRTAPLGQWLHVPDYLTDTSTLGPPVRGGDWSKLRFWSLIEPKDDEVRDDGSARVGLYRLTELGRLWALNLTRVAKHAYIYNNALLKLDDSKTLSVVEALGNGFRYDTLMKEAG